MTPQFDVFLSHTSVDKAWVIKLKDDLLRYGVSVWLDKDEIRPGDLFGKALEQALENCRAVALIVSPDAIKSKWVEEEYYRALSLANSKGTTVQIIPVLLRQAELPGFLKNRNWVDFQDETAYAESVDKLVWGITGKKPRQELDANASDLSSVPLVHSERQTGAIQTTIVPHPISAEIYNKVDPNNSKTILPPNRPKYYFRPVLSWRAVFPQKLQELTPFITLMLKVYTVLLILLCILYGTGTIFPEFLKFIPSIMSEMGLKMTFMKISPLLGPSFIASLISYILLKLAKAKLFDKQIILSILLGSSLLSLAYIFCIFTLLITDKPVAHIIILIIISIAFVVVFFMYSNIEYYWVKKTLGDFTLELLIMLIFVWYMAQLFYNAIIGGTT